MGISDFEFKARGLLEEKMTKYRNSIPRKAVIELVDKICKAYNNQEKSFNPPIKVGDELYSICYDSVAGEWIIWDEPEKVNEVGTKYFFLSSEYPSAKYPDEFHSYREIGKEYFFTYEEAKKAVTELRKKREHEEE